MNMFKPAQVSRMTNVAPSTLRKYVAQFRTWFSEGTQSRFGRKFSEQDIALTKRIKDLFANGLSAAEIDLRLSTPDGGAETPDMLSMIPTVGAGLSEALETARLALETVNRLEKIAEKQNAQIESMSLELKQIRAAQYRSKEDHDRLVHRLDEIEKSSLWGRLSGRGNRPAGR
jgi:DNA-binding transcriptional MerR regulator